MHIHLGLFGRFVRRPDPDGVPARETCRLRIRGDVLAWDLSGAVASELLEPPEEDELLARLGPDPLRKDADPERFAADLAASHRGRADGPVRACRGRQRLPG